ncbi:MAG: D-2-hydroxyacid dehydrogenase [Chlorobi bacterium]|nr:D-2-hydroxyacid dehydrogenase [Chlorobiota bacterium]
MNIVVLDGYTLNPGDLSWSELEVLGEVTIYDRTSKDEILERSINAEILITNKTPLDRELIHNLPKLKYIGVLATGFNVVDIKAASEKGIVVTNVPAYSTKSVAQMVFALILELALNAGLHSEAVKNREWSRSPDFSFWKTPLIELDRLTLGIIGYGQIGREVAKLGNAFGMKILVNVRNEITDPESYVAKVSFDDILSLSDIVTLHIPLTNESKNMITKIQLAKMKNSAFIINTSRGPIVNEDDLAEALNSGKIAGAGLDVLSDEPPSENNPLLKAKNCVITPHIAWATQAARKRLMSVAVNNIKAFIEGQPQNIVN